MKRKNRGKIDIITTTNELPALPVAKDECGNYISIRVANKKDKYYCPVCDGLLNPRAIGEDKDYKVQPHFAHIGNTCNFEGIEHWLYKNWLLDKGSKFKVEGKEYNVSSVDLEVQYTTPFGAYRPDITAKTEQGETFFIEISFSNPKDETFADKWDYLGNPVIEIKTKELIYCDALGNTPTFELIYADGEYKKAFKKLGKKDIYQNDVKKQMATKKQCDDYREVCARLDSLWSATSEYVYFQEDNSLAIEEILKTLDDDDLVWAGKLFTKIKCVDLKNLAIEVSRAKFIEECNEFWNEQISNKCSVEFELEISTKRIYFLKAIIYPVENNRDVFIYRKARVSTKTGVLTKNSLENKVGKYWTVVEMLNGLYRDYQGFKGKEKCLNNFFGNDENVSEINFYVGKYFITNYWENSYKSPPLMIRVEVIDSDGKIIGATKNSFDRSFHGIRMGIESLIGEEARREKMEKSVGEIIHHSSLIDLCNRLEYDYSDDVEVQIQTEISDKSNDGYYIFLNIKSAQYNNQILHLWINDDSFSDVDDWILRNESEIRGEIDAFMQFVKSVLIVCGRINSCKNHFWKCEVDNYYDGLALSISSHAKYFRTTCLIRFDDGIDWNENIVSDEVMEQVNRYIDINCNGKFDSRRLVMVKAGNDNE